MVQAVAAEAGGDGHKRVRVRQRQRGNSQLCLCLRFNSVPMPHMGSTAYMSAAIERVGGRGWGVGGASAQAGMCSDSTTAHVSGKQWPRSCPPTTTPAAHPPSKAAERAPGAGRPLRGQMPWGGAAVASISGNSRPSAQRSAGAGVF